MSTRLSLIALASGGSTSGSCTSVLATASDTDRPIRRSTSSKSLTVLPFSTLPGLVTAPVAASTASVRMVLPAAPGPTRTTFRTISPPSLAAGLVSPEDLLAGSDELVPEDLLAGSDELVPEDLLAGSDEKVFGVINLSH